MRSEVAGVVPNVLVVFGKNVGEVLWRKGRLGGAMVTALPACTLRGKAAAARLDLVTGQGSLGSDPYSRVQTSLSEGADFERQAYRRH